MTTKSGIRVESYVQTADGGLVNFDELTPDQRTRCATALKLRLLGELFRGRAEFRVSDPSVTAAP